MLLFRHLDPNLFTSIKVSRKSNSYSSFKCIHSAVPRNRQETLPPTPCTSLAPQRNQRGWSFQTLPNEPFLTSRRRNHSNILNFIISTMKDKSFNFDLGDVLDDCPILEGSCWFQFVTSPPGANVSSEFARYGVM